MGVKRLWHLIKSAALHKYPKNERLAIDTSIWLHYYKNIPQDLFVYHTTKRIIKLLLDGNKPIFVFDGKTPLLKQRTIAERQKINIELAARKYLRNELCKICNVSVRVCKHFAIEKNEILKANDKNICEKVKKDRPAIWGLEKSEYERYHENEDYKNERGEKPNKTWLKDTESKIRLKSELKGIELDKLKRRVAEEMSKTKKSDIIALVGEKNRSEIKNPITTRDADGSDANKVKDKADTTKNLITRTTESCDDSDANKIKDKADTTKKLITSATERFDDDATSKAEDRINRSDNRLLRIEKKRKKDNRTKKDVKMSLNNLPAKGRIGAKRYFDDEIQILEGAEFNKLSQAKKLKVLVELREKRKMPVKIYSDSGIDFSVEQLNNLRKRNKISAMIKDLESDNKRVQSDCKTTYYFEEDVKKDPELGGDVVCIESIFSSDDIEKSQVESEILMAKTIAEKQPSDDFVVSNNDSLNITTSKDNNLIVDVFSEESEGSKDKIELESNDLSELECVNKMYDIDVESLDDSTLSMSEESSQNMGIDEIIEIQNNCKAINERYKEENNETLEVDKACEEKKYGTSCDTVQNRYESAISLKHKNKLGDQMDHNDAGKVIDASTTSMILVANKNMQTGHIHHSDTSKVIDTSAAHETTALNSNTSVNHINLSDRINEIDTYSLPVHESIALNSNTPVNHINLSDTINEIDTYSLPAHETTALNSNTSVNHINLSDRINEIDKYSLPVHESCVAENNSSIGYIQHSNANKVIDIQATLETCAIDNSTVYCDINHNEAIKVINTPKFSAFEKDVDHRDVIVERKSESTEDVDKNTSFILQDGFVSDLLTTASEDEIESSGYIEDDKNSSKPNFSRFVSINDDYNNEVVILTSRIKEIIKAFDIPYIDAPLESDSQCAYLSQKQLVDAIITEDNDVFLYGCNRVYKNYYKKNKAVESYDKTEINKIITRDEMILLSYYVGSDYTLGIKGIGIKTAYKKVKETEEDKEKASHLFNLYYSDHYKEIDEIEWKKIDKNKVLKYIAKAGLTNEQQREIFYYINRIDNK